jgi:hypothetical protein
LSRTKQSPEDADPGHPLTRSNSRVRRFVVSNDFAPDHLF